MSGRNPGRPADVDRQQEVRPRFHPLLEQRLHLLDTITSFEGSTAEARAGWNAPHGNHEDWELQVADREVPGTHGRVPVRTYTPSSQAPPQPRPCLVWVHGGGFVSGDLDMPEAHEVARGVAGRADAVVVSVGYRLCPPAPAFHSSARPAAQEAVRFPVPLDDVVDAFLWTCGQAEELGIDPRRVAIGGASAGAALAAGAVIRLAEGGTTPWQAILLYGLFHPTLPEATPEMGAALRMLPSAICLRPDAVEAMNENYLGAPLASATPHAFAGLAEDLSGFPSTLLDNCEFDSLRRSGEAFGRALQAARVPVEAVVSRGVSHGHLNRIGFPPAQASLDRIAARLRRSTA